MFSTDDLLFLLILFLACIVSGLAGFGSNILALPFLSLFLDLKLVVPVLVLAVLCNGIPRLLTQYRSVNLPVFLCMLPFAVGGGILGVHLAGVLHEGWMKLLLACLMLFVAAKGLRDLRLGAAARPSRIRNNPLLLAIPFLGGILQAAFACGGPVFNLYILLKLRDKNEIRATQFAIGVTSASFIAAQYLVSGAYQGQTLHFAVLLIPAVFLAYLVSEKIFRHINGPNFLRFVYLVLLLSGVLTGWQALQLF